MVILNPQLPANLFIRSSDAAAAVLEVRQLELQLNQVVRATVVGSELDRVLLELDQQQFQARTEKELLVGQELRLQVLKTLPRPEFRVLNDFPGDKLARLLPLLTRSFNWGDTVSRLQQLDPARVDMSQQLLQLLGPLPERQLTARDQILALMAQLRVFESKGSTGSFGSGPVVNHAALFRPSLPVNLNQVSQPLDKMIFEMVRSLRDQIAELKTVAKRDVVPPQWLARTRSVLEPLQGSGRLATEVELSPPARQLLADTLLQLKSQPRLTPQLAVAVERILQQIKNTEIPRPVPPTSPGSPPVGRAVVTEGRISSASPPVSSVPHANPHSANAAPADPSRVHVAPSSTVNPPQLEGELKQLLGTVQQVADQKSGMPPELMGRLEGLVLRLKQVAERHPGQLAVFNNMAAQLTPLLGQKTEVPQRAHLGVLSQLFGFFLEAELLQGKARAALASLKLSLLQLQEELGEDAAEPLRRLELFQLCKARLAEDNVQFLPLPFPELEEGYLLAEDCSAGRDEKGAKGVHLSLSLRLSALGNVRVDMLYQPGQGLKMQIAGENQEKKRYIEDCADELVETVEAVPVKSVSFSADARLPAKQLQERLLPDTNSMLDTRI